MENNQEKEPATLFSKIMAATSAWATHNKYDMKGEETKESKLKRDLSRLLNVGDCNGYERHIARLLSILTGEEIFFNEDKKDTRISSPPGFVGNDHVPCYCLLVALCSMASPNANIKEAGYFSFHTSGNDGYYGSLLFSPEGECLGAQNNMSLLKSSWRPATEKEIKLFCKNLAKI